MMQDVHGLISAGLIEQKGGDGGKQVYHDTSSRACFLTSLGLSSINTILEA